MIIRSMNAMCDLSCMISSFDEASDDKFLLYDFFIDNGALRDEI
jgi:hypothetical protein